MLCSNKYHCVPGRLNSRRFYISSNVHSSPRSLLQAFIIHEFGSWIYALLAIVEAARPWADQISRFLSDSIEPLLVPAVHRRDHVETRKLPYVLADGSDQYPHICLAGLKALCSTCTATRRTQHI